MYNSGLKIKKITRKWQSYPSMKESRCVTSQCFLQSSWNTMASHISGHFLHNRLSARNYICDFRIEVSIPEMEINIKSTNEAQNKLIQVSQLPTCPRQVCLQCSLEKRASLLLGSWELQQGLITALEYRKQSPGVTTWEACQGYQKAPWEPRCFFQH